MGRSGAVDPVPLVPAEVERKEARQTAVVPLPLLPRPLLLEVLRRQVRISYHTPDCNGIS